MPRDWKKLEDDDQQRWQRVSILMGTTWALIGLVGTVVLLAIGQSSRVPGSLISALIGLVILAPGLVARKRTRQGQD